MATKKKTTSPEIEELQNQIQALDGNWKRALADYQNLLKRNQSEKQDFIKFATRNLVSEFIPALDMLDLAAEHSQDPGVKMAVGVLREAMRNAGVEEIIPQVGEEFNPVFHECIENVPGEPVNTIAGLVSTGYKVGEDFVIRPAKVKVYVAN